MADEQSPTTNSESLLIYDGECRLCVTAKERIERLDSGKYVRFVPYQSDEAVRCLAGEYRPGRPEVAFLVGPDGGVSRGLDAFVPLLPGLPGGRLGLALLKIPLMRPLAVLVYRLIARYRYRLFGQVVPR